MKALPLSCDSASSAVEVSLGALSGVVQAQVLAQAEGYYGVFMGEIDAHSRIKARQVNATCSGMACFTSPGMVGTGSQQQPPPHAPLQNDEM